MIHLYSEKERIPGFKLSEVYTLTSGDNNSLGERTGFSRGREVKKPFTRRLIAEH